MGVINLTNIRIYAFHGCLKEETAIGSDYLVNVKVWANLSKASISDNLSDTVDYVHINKIVSKEMAIPSKLLEHVAKRILNRFFSEIPLVKKAQVSVSKINPPIGGDAENVCVSLKAKRP